MMRDMPKVGQTVYIERKHRSKPSEIKEKEVEKVGRSYFYLKGMNEAINLTDWMYKSKDYSQFNFQVYFSKEEIEEEKEVNKIHYTLQSCFDWRSKNHGFTLQQLREVVKILGL